MSDRNVGQLTEKAKEVLKLVGEIKSLATEGDYGVVFSVNDGHVEFEDWLSSDCYGEGNDENFTVGDDGSVWYSSSC